MKAMLLTAGLGTRLRPVTNAFAKPAVPFLNVPLLYYPVMLLERAGVDELVLNSHHKPEQIERLAAGIPGFKGRTVVSHEPGAPLGSGGGIWKARKHLEGADFLLANGDEVILPKDPEIMQKLRDEHVAHRALATILVMRHPLVGTQFGGVWADRDGRVLGFGKDGRAFGASGAAVTGYHYIGLVYMSDRVFGYLPEGESNILYDALTKAISAGETVRVVVGEFGWFETGNERDFLRATRECLELLEHGAQGDSGDHDEAADGCCGGCAGCDCASDDDRKNETSFLHEVIHRFAPSSQVVGVDDPRFKGVDITVETSVFLAGNCVIEPGAKLRGSVVLGEGSVVRGSACVQDSVLLPDTSIAAGTSVTSRIWFAGAE